MTEDRAQCTHALHSSLARRRIDTDTGHRRDRTGQAHTRTRYYLPPPNALFSNALFSNAVALASLCASSCGSALCAAQPKHGCDAAPPLLHNAQVRWWHNTSAHRARTRPRATDRRANVASSRHYGLIPSRPDHLPCRHPAPSSPHPLKGRSKMGAVCCCCVVI
jgi:hypothetical protein